MTPVAVIVILNGMVLASAPPAELLFGHVLAPVTPVIVRLADRASVDGDMLTIAGRGRTCVLRIGSNTMDCDGQTVVLPVLPFARAGVPYVPLAEVARALGDSVTYDPRERTAEVDVLPQTDVQSPAPFNPSAPSAAPTIVFTPSPAPAPRTTPAVVGSPQPRRTAIPAIPSRVPEN